MLLQQVDRICALVTNRGHGVPASTWTSYNGDSISSIPTLLLQAYGRIHRPSFILPFAIDLSAHAFHSIVDVGTLLLDKFILHDTTSAMTTSTSSPAQRRGTAGSSPEQLLVFLLRLAATNLGRLQATGILLDDDAGTTRYSGQRTNRGAALEALRTLLQRAIGVGGDVPDSRPVVVAAAAALAAGRHVFSLNSPSTIDTELRSATDGSGVLEVELAWPAIGAQHKALTLRQQYYEQRRINTLSRKHKVDVSGADPRVDHVVLLLQAAAAARGWRSTTEGVWGRYITFVADVKTSSVNAARDFLESGLRSILAAADMHGWSLPDGLLVAPIIEFSIENLLFSGNERQFARGLGAAAAVVPAGMGVVRWYLLRVATYEAVVDAVSAGVKLAREVTVIATRAAAGEYSAINDNGDGTICAGLETRAMGMLNATAVDHVDVLNCVQSAHRRAAAAQSTLAGVAALSGLSLTFDVFGDPDVAPFVGEGNESCDGIIDLAIGASGMEKLQGHRSNIRQDRTEVARSAPDEDVDTGAAAPPNNAVTGAPVNVAAKRAITQSVAAESVQHSPASLWAARYFEGSIAHSSEALRGSTTARVPYEFAGDTRMCNLWNTMMAARDDAADAWWTAVGPMVSAMRDRHVIDGSSLSRERRNGGRPNRSGEAGSSHRRRRLGDPSSRADRSIAHNHDDYWDDNERGYNDDDAEDEDDDGNAREGDEDEVDEVRNGIAKQILLVTCNAVLTARHSRL